MQVILLNTKCVLTFVHISYSCLCLNGRLFIFKNCLLHFGFYLKIVATAEIFLNIFSTAFPRNSDPFYIVSTYMKWVTTSWTYRMYAKASGDIFVISLCSMMRLSIKLAVKAVR